MIKSNTLEYNTSVRASFGCAIALTSLVPAFAGDPPALAPACVLPPDDTCQVLADDHAPIGVMNDHLHQAGEWMLGLHWMHMEMDGHRAGTDELSSAEVFSTTSPTGTPYSVAATSMEMDMLMAHVMYAPTDWLTLSAMPQYVWKSMDLELNPQAMAHGHGAHSGSGHGGHGGSHSHSTEGWGDLPVTALFPLWQSGDHSMQLIGGLGVSIPTGSVEETQDGSYLPYGMQLGSGTWDLLPSLSWSHQLGRFGYGAQLGAIIPLEDEGESGYRHSELYRATLWTSYRAFDWMSLSARVAGSSQDSLDGHYNGPHAHRAPNHFQGNYGGEYVDLGLGANFVVIGGPLCGHRFGVEVLLPVHQDAHGVGMNRDWSLNLGWQFSF